MNSESDERLTSKSETSAARPTFLRLIRGDERLPRPTGSAEAADQMQRKQSLGPQWDDNDDDPGPTAA